MPPKQPTKRSRGRPKVDEPLDDQVFIRVDKETREALAKYATRYKVGAESTAARIILVERLRKEGLL